ncbi:hypothetical protein, partial [Pseudomonas aeruginosa]
MSSSRLGVLALALLRLTATLLGGCENTHQHLLAQGYPPANADGFDDGIGGRVALGEQVLVGVFAAAEQGGGEQEQGEDKHAETRRRHGWDSSTAGTGLPEVRAGPASGPGASLGR